jgi:hypothetical protein
VRSTFILGLGLSPTVSEKSTFACQESCPHSALSYQLATSSLFFSFLKANLLSWLYFLFLRFFIKILLVFSIGKVRH